MIEDEEQPQLLNTIGEYPTEEVGTIEEDIYVLGVESLNGKTGDLSIKTINGEDLVEEGNIDLQTPLDSDQMAAVNSGIDAEKVSQIATNAQNITTLQNTKQDKLTQTQLNAVNSGIDQTKVAQIATNTSNITSNTNRVTTIEGKIPSAASSSNKLTDKNYVDNAIATNTANYISDNGQPFQSYADLVAYSGPLTNNDYAFVETIDQAGNDIYTRYKYNADQNLWAEEYTITNPYFTSDQWAAINSGVTQNDVNQIDTNKGDIADLQTSKQDALSQTQLDAINSGIDATKVQQISDNTTAIATKQDKLVAGANIQIGPDGKTISATDTTYTAGTGLTLTGTQFSVTEPVPAGFFTDTTAEQTGTGSSITLNNTVDAPIDNAELKGDTFQQTYSGKNLMPYNTYTSDDGRIMSMPNLRLGTSTFTISFDLDSFTIGTAQNVRLFIQLQDSGGNYVNNQNNPILTIVSGTSLGRYSYTFTTTGDTNNVSTNMRADSTSFNAGAKVAISNIQIESGSSPTAYEPYVGGVPSPNPDYPQDIQVVTGEQTVVVSDGGSNSQSYTIDLGAIELCKIGTYRDYIYKANGNWYKHAEVGKVVMTGGADETWSYNTTQQVFVANDLADYDRSGFVPYCNYYKGENVSAYSALSNYCISFVAIQNSRVAIKNTDYTSTSNFKSWLSTHNTTAYYVLATAADTQITDAALISQLDALASSTTYAPQTNYATSTASPNLPTILTVDVFKNNYAGLLARLNKAGA